MYILYVDLDKLDVSQVKNIYNNLKETIKEDIVILPMNTTKLIWMDSLEGEDRYGRYYYCERY